MDKPEENQQANLTTKTDTFPSSESSPHLAIFTSNIPPSTVLPSQAVIPVVNNDEDDSDDDEMTSELLALATSTPTPQISPPLAPAPAVPTHPAHDTRIPLSPEKMATTPVLQNAPTELVPTKPQQPTISPRNENTSDDPSKLGKRHANADMNTDMDKSHLGNRHGQTTDSSEPSTKRLRTEPNTVVPVYSVTRPASAAAESNVDNFNLVSDIVDHSPLPSVQDESRVKEEDPEENPEKSDNPSLHDTPSTAHRGTNGGTTSPQKNITGNTGTKGTNQPDDDYDSEEERPLDLASINAFEYERVVSTNQAALRRYEQYRRSDLKNNKVKRVLQSLNPSLAKVNEPYIIAVKGLAKMFVGDVTEMAIRVRIERGDKGALQPSHLREAYRRLRLAGVFPNLHERSVSFS